jgi:viroplasmin and RNaseH domain-containing protein
MEKKQESLIPERGKNGIFKTWKEKKQESLRPGREKAGIFKTWKGKHRNLYDWKENSRNL